MAVVEDELSALRSFIEEQQQWLHSVLDILGWSKESLEHGQPCLMQCPYNNHHFIAKSSVEKHRPKCRYGAVCVITANETALEKANTFVSIGSSVVQAIKKYAATSVERVAEGLQPVQQRRDHIDQSDVVVESHDDKVSSLESQKTTPPDLLVQGPLHIIRYIKAWPLVPADFLTISSGSLNPVEVKAWLFSNLPDKHSYSSQLGGEIQAVETVTQTLTSQPSQSPDSLVARLTPLFGQQCKAFVLRLWKFLHTVALQKQHTILDSAVDELTPLHQSAVSFLMSEEAASDKGAVGESFAGKIQAMAAEDGHPSSPLPPLPMDCVPSILTPQERKLLYDYVVEVGGMVPGSHLKDPSLYRDDAAAIKAKLKQQAREKSEMDAREEGEGGRGRVSLYQMKKERDYRRRRQKYRARNVHITRRTPAQVMRDIINARMLEISSSAASTAREESSLTKEEDKSDRGGGINEPHREAAKKDQSVERELERDEKRRDSRSSHRHHSDRESGSRESSRRSRSRERLKRDSRRRSRSRERGGMRKRSRSTSRSRRHSKHSESSAERDRHKKKSRDRNRDRRSSKNERGTKSSSDKPRRT